MEKNELDLAMPYHNREITVIIPTLNEAEGVEPTIREIQKALNNVEILVIDGNSLDETPYISKRLGAKLVLQKGSGKGQAIAQAISHLSEHTKYVVIIDGDYTYPARHIPKMISILEKDPQVGMVTGDRFSPQKFSVHFKNVIFDPPFYFGNIFLKLAHWALNGIRMKDPLSGLRVIRYDVLKEFRPKARGFDIEVEINRYIKQIGVKNYELSIGYRQRLGKKKLRMPHGVLILARIVAMAVEDSLQNLRRQF